MASRKRTIPKISAVSSAPRATLTPRWGSIRPGAPASIGGSMACPRRSSSRATGRSPISLSVRWMRRRWRASSGRKSTRRWNEQSRASVHYPFRVWAIERKSRDFHLEGTAVLVDHLIGSDHNAARGLERTARCVAESVAGPQSRLLANDAGPLHVLAPAAGVGDLPMAMRKLDGQIAAIGDLDRIGPEIATLVRLGMFGEELRLDGHPDVVVARVIHGRQSSKGGAPSPVARRRGEMSERGDQDGGDRLAGASRRLRQRQR